ncbi:hypothetical protein R70199_07009 [Paraburkholderia domus]|nr:hypothetical protein R70199_07009 [Paraburkholderia domus]
MALRQYEFESTQPQENGLELNLWVYRADKTLCFAYRDEEGRFFSEADGAPITDVLAFARWVPTGLPN